MELTMTQLKLVRTPMADAFVNAQHRAQHEGHNTRNIGRVVLTNEAKGVGVIYRPRKKMIDLPKKAAV